METTTLDYRGFRLLVTPVMDHEGLWEYSYRILRTGQRADARGRGPAPAQHQFP